MYERKCKRCGATFIRISLTDYLYRDNKGGIYCGYNCWIRRDDKKKKKVSNHGSAKP